MSIRRGRISIGVLLLLIVGTVPGWSQPSFVLTNADIETVANGRIEGGTIVVQDGLIAAVGTDVVVPRDLRVIDCEGQMIYPGLIDAGTQLGLVEVGSLPETRDDDEMGRITPHMQSLTAVNPNSVAIPVTRTNGITTVLTAPTGGLLPGTGAMIDLHGYTPDQMDAGVRTLHINFPGIGPRGWRDDRSPEKRRKDWEEQMRVLDDVFDQAEIFAELVGDRDPFDVLNEGRTYENTAPLAAMLPALSGATPIVIEVNNAADIDSALSWVERRRLPNVILAGVREGWRVADRIAESGLPCIVGPILTLPSRASDRYDKAYSNVALLAEAGVPVAIRSGQSVNVRNLPFNAGFAAAFGLGVEGALRAVTLTPAEIFGLDDRLGSIEVGKQATMFVADGDPFETSTQVTRLFIRGNQVPLESRHTRLHDEFLDRNP